jgi:predicted ATPase
VLHPATPPLAGRDDEQAALTARWARARTGTGGIVLLSGAPGGGKTGLANALAATARSDGALVLAGKCDADSALPLAALRGAIEEHLRAVAALPPVEQAAAVRRLREAAGDGASLLRPLSPRLAMMLDAPLLAADDRHDQFAGAVASFLTALVGHAGGAGSTRRAVACCAGLPRTSTTALCW